MITPYEEEFFEQNPPGVNICSKEAWEAGIASPFFAQLQHIYATQIFAIRNQLEDQNAPLEDFQFQRGRICQARDFFELVKIQTETYLQEAAEAALEDEEQEYEDVND